jgi:hypothetical protein
MGANDIVNVAAVVEAQAVGNLHRMPERVGARCRSPALTMKD